VLPDIAAGLKDKTGNGQHRKAEQKCRKKNAGFPAALQQTALKGL
jgi:hypothetical protein